VNSPSVSGASDGEQAEAGASRVRLGNVELDLGTYRVSIADRRPDLTYQEFELLRFLSRYPDQVVSFVALTRFLWGTAGQKEMRRLNVLVCRLRAKLAGSEPYLIETVRGRGYGLLSGAGGSPVAGGRKGGTA
jgi:DNA-binding response OmpR family regulator